mmetsp:Transcript_31815/g.38981  ORF Transcript_31815/g.38981 Transcript_31815/m.38981 type:complete len:118 (-) Transcript_31815:1620-1973(-)
MTSHQSNDHDEAMAAADKELEERAKRAKELLSQRYRGMRHEQEAKHARKMQLERTMIGLPEERKQTLRSVLEQEENLVSKESRKKDHHRRLRISDRDRKGCFRRSALSAATSEKERH